MASIFQIEPSRRVRRTKFHLNHEVKTTARFGELTPILCQEVLPGDTWKLQTEQLIRFAPTLAPVMHRVNAFLHYYFVPNRLLMKDLWEDFISPNNGLTDEERPELPYILFDGLSGSAAETGAYTTLCQRVQSSRLLDHIGFQFADNWPAAGAANDDAWWDGRLKLPLLPLCAYWLIMQDYYLDENQTDLRRIKKAIGEICKVGECSLSDLIQKTNDSIDYSVFESDFWSIGTTQYEANIVGFISLMLTLCQRAYEKDYFTSALPTTQRGEEITLGQASIKLPEMHVAAGQDVTTGIAEKPDGSSVGFSGAIGNFSTDGDRLYSIDTSSTPVSSSQVVLKGSTTSQGDVVDADGEPIEGTEIPANPVTINELRRAIRLQEFLEKSMRGGYRLIEQIFAHFGVISSNKLLDRPQFLGGASNAVTISEITGTASTELSHLGEYSGHMQSFGGSRVVKFRSEEHGWLFCFLSVLPRTNYCQGFPRQFARHDRFDFAWPEFSHLGEQEVYEHELWFSGAAAEDSSKETFGYQSRYAEYKYIPSHISGDFRKTLDHWTMARMFENKPTLSNQFLQCNPMDDNNTRIFTVQDDSDYLYCQFYHKILAKRCLPKFGVPML